MKRKIYKLILRLLLVILYIFALALGIIMAYFTNYFNTKK
jgi:flagellar basal body-associated protein FliL